MFVRGSVNELSLINDFLTILQMCSGMSKATTQNETYIKLAKLCKIGYFLAAMGFLCLLIYFHCNFVLLQKLLFYITVYCSVFLITITFYKTPCY